MTFEKARKVLQDMKLAEELSPTTTAYGETGEKHKEQAEALDFAIKLMNKIDYKIETLEEELKRFSGRRAKGGGKSITVLIRISEIDYAIDVLKWLDLEGWARND